MYLVSFTNTHRDIINSASHGMVKNTKTWISWEWNIIFLQNKKILNLCLRWHILRSYHFVAEVTLKGCQCILVVVVIPCKTLQEFRSKYNRKFGLNNFVYIRALSWNAEITGKIGLDNVKSCCLCNCNSYLTGS